MGKPLQAAGKDAVGKGRCSLWPSRGAGCWRRIRNAWGAVCQGRGGDALKPPFVWEEKGSLWLVTVETEWGFSRLLGRAPPSSHAVRRPGCHRSQGDPGTGCDRRVALPGHVLGGGRWPVRDTCLQTASEKYLWPNYLTQAVSTRSEFTSCRRLSLLLRCPTSISLNFGIAAREEEEV